MLRPLTIHTHPDLLVGLQTSDDAAVYRLTDELALIQTVDFFPPVVDDPYAFGAIAAANAMSDIYAMGGRVTLALNIAAFPADLSLDILASIFEGGADKVAEAGGVVAGGHTVTDDEPKYGLVVTGTIEPKRVLTKAGAKPGELIYLTKPLGTGVITTALKAGAAAEEHVASAVESMTRLNRSAAQAMVDAGASAATDVTGFGIVGHAIEMAEKSGVYIRFDVRGIPLLAGAQRYAADGFLPGGAQRNQEFYAGSVGTPLQIDSRTPDDLQSLLFDPETSGGLLISIDPNHSETFEHRCRELGQPFWRCGRVETGLGVEFSWDR